MNSSSANCDIAVGHLITERCLRIARIPSVSNVHSNSIFRIIARCSNICLLSPDIVAVAAFDHDDRATYDLRHYSSGALVASCMTDVRTIHVDVAILLNALRPGVTIGMAVRGHMSVLSDNTMIAALLTLIKPA